MFAKSAERAYARFRVGDQFVASGYITEYELERTGRRAREQFVAKQIGHDTTWTRYSVDRTPANQPDPPAATCLGRVSPPRVVGL